MDINTKDESAVVTMVTIYLCLVKIEDLRQYLYQLPNPLYYSNHGPQNSFVYQCLVTVANDATSRISATSLARACRLRQTPKSGQKPTSKSVINKTQGSQQSQQCVLTLVEYSSYDLSGHPTDSLLNCLDRGHSFLSFRSPDGRSDF